MNVDMKERAEMVQVMETAEDWIARVRIAMANAGVATLQNLEVLLGEADDIPVCMEEHQLLLGEIKARKLSAKVNEALESKSARLDTLYGLVSEFESIRESLPLEPRAKKNWRVKEEVELKRVVGEVETWKTKVKRALAAKKGTALSRLQALITETRSIPANLQTHLRPLEAILSKAQEWRKTHADLISVCLDATRQVDSSQDMDLELVPTDKSTESIEVAPVAHVTAQTRAADLPSALEESQAMEMETAREPSPNVAIPTLEACIVAGEKINAQIEEMGTLQQLMADAKGWVGTADSLCPKRQTKRSRKLSAKPTVEQIREHIAMANTLPFDVSTEITRLETCISDAETWRESARFILESISADPSSRAQALGPISCSTLSSPDHKPLTPSATSTESLVPTPVEAPSIVTGMAADAPAAAGTSEASTGLSREASDETLESLRSLLRGAEMVNIRTEEEALAEKFLSLHAWCSDAQSFIESHFSGPKTVCSIAQFDSLVKAGAKFSGQLDEGSSVVPAFLDHVMKVGLEKLGVLNKERTAIHEWCKRSKKAMEDAALTLPLASSILAEANTFQVRVEEVQHTVKEIDGIHSWLLRSDAALSGAVNQKLDMKQFKELLEQGEKIRVDQSRLKEMRAQLKLARAWKAKVKKTGIERGEATISQLRALLPEAKSIHIDLRDEIEMLRQATSKHCICRRSPQPKMIQCVMCEVWYHKGCVDINGQEKQSYCCPRCIVLNFYTRVVEVVFHHVDTVSWPTQQVSTVISHPRSRSGSFGSMPETSNAPSAAASSTGAAPLQLTASQTAKEAPAVTTSMPQQLNMNNLGPDAASAANSNADLDSQYLVPSVQQMLLARPTLEQAVTNTGPGIFGGDGMPLANPFMSLGDANRSALGGGLPFPGPTSPQLDSQPDLMSNGEGLSQAVRQWMEAVRKALMPEYPSSTDLSAPPIGGSLPATFQQLKQQVEAMQLETVPEVRWVYPYS